MKKYQKIGLVLIFLLLVSLIVYFRYRINSIQNYTKISTDTEQWVKTSVREDPYNPITKLGLREYPGENSDIITVSGILIERNETLLVIESDKSQYRIKANPDQKVLVVDQRLEPEEQLDSLTTISLNELQLQNYVTINCKADNSGVLVAENIQRDIY